ncbi:FMN-binding protein [bacterium D16-51]|nr:FMN-binding protein [bacterium D16-59]RKI57619.1 FMN-binding protein [bacterium D16-51]
MIMKKKSRMVLILAGFACILSGCSGSGTDAGNEYEIAEAGTWEDGIYSEMAEGKKGKFEVTVKIQDGSIESVMIGDNEETPDKGGVAIEQLPDEMIKEQTYQVDAVSGATVTSDGIKDAVAKCLEKASQ